MRLRRSPIVPNVAPLTRRSVTRMRLTEHFFESFEVNEFAVSCSSLMALHAMGRTTGVVVALGEGHASVRAIVEGYTLSHTERIDVCGRDLTEYFARVRSVP